MKNFWKCLKTDFWSIWGETGAVCIMIIFIYVFGGSELWFPWRADPVDYGIGAMGIAVLVCCFYRVFKRLFYTAMFTDQGILYQSLPVSTACSITSKIVASGAAVTLVVVEIYALQVFRLWRRTGEFTSHEFRTRTMNQYLAFMDTLGIRLLVSAIASFALAALIFAAVAVYQKRKRVLK